MPILGGIRACHNIRKRNGQLKGLIASGSNSRQDVCLKFCEGSNPAVVTNSNTNVGLVYTSPSVTDWLGRDTTRTAQMTSSWVLMAAQTAALDHLDNLPKERCVARLLYDLCKRFRLLSGLHAVFGLEYVSGPWDLASLRSDWVLRGPDKSSASRAQFS